MDSSGVWDSEGFMCTGDIVYYDTDLCFYIIDRIKEMLKFRSWHVSPALLEGILEQHPMVKRAVVIGIPHEEDGDHPQGLVMLVDGCQVTEEDLLEYVNQKVDDRQKLRGGIKFIKDIVVTPTGKINRRVMKERMLSEITGRV